MKIAFDHQIFALQPYGGISRYFVRLARALAALGATAEVFAPLHQNRFLRELPASQVHGFGLATFPARGTALIDAANRRWSAIRALGLRPDVVHETYYSPVGAAMSGRARVLTVYDMIHERFHAELPAGDLTSINKRAAVARADHVICISHSTRADLCEILGVPPEKTSVVHLGFDVFAGSRAGPPAQPASRPFLLFVGNRGGYKNFGRLLRAVASRSDLSRTFDIVAFGGGAFRPDETELISGLGFGHERVRQVGGGDDVLGGLYRKATALVFPSLYEGFGLPPLEAMAHGCPVISSNTSSMPEVVGPAGEYFDPADVEAQAEAICRAVFDDRRRLALIEAGGRRIGEFSWERCAAETLRVYGSVARPGRAA
jgi:glycosyltransferase involved in cell wall biosynthesis